MSLSQLELIANNRPGPHCEQVGVRYSVLDSAVADFKAKMARLFELEDRAAHCTCGASHAALLFEIDHSRADAKPYEIMAQEAVVRMQERGVL